MNRTEDLNRKAEIEKGSRGGTKANKARVMEARAKGGGRGPGLTERRSVSWGGAEPAGRDAGVS